MIPRLDSWPTPSQAFALVASPRLGLQQVTCHMEFLFVLVHEVWNLHPLLHYSFLWEYVVQHILFFLDEGNNFFMKLKVVEKAH